MKTLIHVWTQTPYNVPVSDYAWRFGIDIKMRKIKWKSSWSKSMTLLQKLEETKEKLREFKDDPIPQTEDNQ